MTISRFDAAVQAADLLLRGLVAGDEDRLGSTAKRVSVLDLSVIVDAAADTLAVAGWRPDGADALNIADAHAGGLIAQAEAALAESRAEAVALVRARDAARNRLATISEQHVADETRLRARIDELVDAGETMLRRAHDLDNHLDVSTADVEHELGALMDAVEAWRTLSSADSVTTAAHDLGVELASTRLRLTHVEEELAQARATIETAAHGAIDAEDRLAVLRGEVDVAEAAGAFLAAKAEAVIPHIVAGHEAARAALVVALSRWDGRHGSNAQRDAPEERTAPVDFDVVDAVIEEHSG